MKTLKGWITTTSLSAVILLSTTSGNAGIIVGGRSSQLAEPCRQKVEETTSDYLKEMIIGSLTGIIIGGLSGIIVGGVAIDQPENNCGIIVGS